MFFEVIFELVVVFGPEFPIRVHNKLHQPPPRIAYMDLGIVPLAASGEIPSVKINGKLNFPKSDLQEWVDQQIEHDVSRANAGKLLAESAMRKENRGTNL